MGAVVVIFRNSPDPPGSTQFVDFDLNFANDGKPLPAHYSVIAGRNVQFLQNNGPRLIVARVFAPFLTWTS